MDAINKEELGQEKTKQEPDAENGGNNQTSLKPFHLLLTIYGAIVIVSILLRIVFK